LVGQFVHVLLGSEQTFLTMLSMHSAL